MSYLLLLATSQSDRWANRGSLLFQISGWVSGITAKVNFLSVVDASVCGPLATWVGAPYFTGGAATW